MDRDGAYRKWQALRRVTVANGATTHEAATAARLASVLASRFGFADQEPRQYREDFAPRYERAEARAARRWNWEYRQCYKPRCHCMKSDSPHGPYRYAKQRDGRTVRSVYIGR